jgi:hypothetical protein
MPAVLTKWSTCVTLDNGQKVLPGNTVLTSLVLDENVIGEAGIDALREALAKNSTIVMFSIACNPDVPPDVAESLARKASVTEPME